MHQRLNIEKELRPLQSGERRDMQYVLRILHLEDDPFDAELIQSALADAGTAYRIHRVSTRNGFVAAIDRGGFELILSDYSLPSFDGLSALAIAKERCPNIPFIFVTGKMGEELAIEMLKGGATDYVMKTNIGRLGSSVQRALRETTERSERKKAQEALRESSAEIQDLYNNAPCGYHSLDKDGLFVRINDTELSWLGYSRDELVEKKKFHDILTPESRRTFNETFPILKESGRMHDIEYDMVRKDGTIFPVLLNSTAITDAAGNFAMCRSTVYDITRRKELEQLSHEAMRTAHLASIGELAAGVAHEINNPISGVINYAELLLYDCGSESRVNEIARRIIEEGVRIANIVKSLLSFARQGGEEKRPVKIKDILFESLTLTKTMLKKDGIRLKLFLDSDLPPVIANFQQIEQVFLNLIDNSRYALKQKYRGASEDKQIQITFEVIFKGEKPYLRTMFLDNGTGISNDMIDKIKDPFVSTKPASEGTGLGLSISHGIISDHNGTLTIESVEGDFTKVIIDLPALTPREEKNEE